MIRLTTNILKQFSRSQNFFSQNPIYPDFGEKEFDIYNGERKKIDVLDIYGKRKTHKEMVRSQIRKHFMMPKSAKRKSNSYIKGSEVRDQNEFVLGIHEDFDNFAQEFKKRRAADASAKSDFLKAVDMLIKKYKMKNIIELIKIFRIGIAFQNKKSRIEKLKGKILREIVNQASKNKEFQNGLDEQELNLQVQEGQQEEHEKALKEIDAKILQMQESLGYNTKTLQSKYYSKYHSEYGWQQERSEEYNEQRDINLQIGHQKIVKTSENPYGKNMQDKSIKTRINKFYFLRRLELLNEQKDSLNSFNKDLPINLKKNQTFMNKIAHKYKEYELYQQPNLQQIYRDVEVVFDKIHVRISPTSDLSQASKGHEMVEEKVDSSMYLWENLNVQEVFAPSLYTEAESVQLRQSTALQLSPSPRAQLSIGRMPINFHRHSELDIFGAFSSERGKIERGVFDSTELDHQPSFRYYSAVQQVQQSFQTAQQRSWKNKKVSTVGIAKRKSAEAEVSTKIGTGKVTINGKNVRDYFADPYYRAEALKPLLFTQTATRLDVNIQVVGGGLHSQSQCIAYALAKALLKINKNYKKLLNAFGLIGTDFRRKEEKRMNKYSARVSPPYIRR